MIIYKPSYLKIFIVNIFSVDYCPAGQIDFERFLEAGYLENAAEKLEKKLPKKKIASFKKQIFDSII